LLFAILPVNGITAKAPHLLYYEYYLLFINILLLYITIFFVILQIIKGAFHPVRRGSIQCGIEKNPLF